ncbi:polysaccharide biosynthesis/export family protein [Cyanobium sp. HWJ4-Hawea]|nr:polysaccharide biosynthesis/export family protein [Cyanobium sp. HWJ4-Hawea]
MGQVAVASPAPQRTAVPIRAKTQAAATANSPIPAKSRSSVIYDTYILGPGDSLQVELIDIPELSGVYSIGPDGTMYLPRLRALYVEGLTVEELRYFLQQQFKAYVRSPEVYVRPVTYRPIRVYVGGEVRRPGYYILSGAQKLSGVSGSADSSIAADGGANFSSRPGVSGADLAGGSQGALASGGGSAIGGSGVVTFGALFPTVFDAIKTAEGITPFSNLADIQVTRRQALGVGGGKIRTNLNFLSLLSEGDESQNIRLFDGDVVYITKSTVVLRDQLLKAGQTNLNPKFLQVFMSGRVNTPGAVTVPQGGTLNQAIAIAGGLKLLRGQISFIRFTNEGEVDRRVFSYSPGASSNSLKNPILVAGDIIQVQESALSAGVTVLQEITAPLLGIYATQQVFSNLK